jgi:hypothetical protein
MIIGFAKVLRAALYDLNAVSLFVSLTDIGAAPDPDAEAVAAAFAVLLFELAGAALPVALTEATRFAADDIKTPF